MANTNEKYQLDQKIKSDHTLAIDYIKTKYKFRFNMMTQSIEKTTFGKEEWESVVLEDLWIELNKCPTELTKTTAKGVKKCIGYGKGFVSGILSSEKIVPKYDPYKDWLKSLSWEELRKKLPFPARDDLTPFHQLALLIKFSRDDENESNRFVQSLKNWFIRAIRCLFEENFSSKECLVLTGKQGTGKTSFLRSFLPLKLQKGIVESPFLRNKNAYLSQATALITIIDEVDHWLAVADNRNRYKAFMTNLNVNERPPYGRTRVSMNRITSFLGTCNTTDFLKDATENDRWIVFEIDHFINRRYAESKGNKEVFTIENFPMSSLWAFAFKEYRNGFLGDITEEEKIENRKKNEYFRNNPTKLHLLNKYYKKSSIDDPQAIFVSSAQMCKRIKSFEPSERIFSNTLGKALMRENFPRHKRNGRVGYWVEEITPQNNDK